MVDALAATLYQLFPTVYAIDEPGPADNLSNSLLVATRQAVDLPTVLANLTQPQPAKPVEFQEFVTTTRAQVRLVPPTEHALFTDDRAPVEWVVHRIIWDFMTGGQSGSYDQSDPPTGAHP
ncbi:MAG: hypothetical protein R2867_05195 [Caldilineaceae bacterium]